MSDIESKKNTLKKMGISVLDGDSNNIFLKYKDKTLPYNTRSYTLFNINYLITDIMKIFQLEQKEDTFLMDLEKKKTYLKKLRINKIWFNERFYLEKNNTLIKYEFDDYIDMEPDLFIADVKNRFNKLETKNLFEKEDISDNNSDNIFLESPISKNDVIVDIYKMKLNIKTILTERGFIKNA